MDDNDEDILQEVNKTKMEPETDKNAAAAMPAPAEDDPFASLDMGDNPLGDLFDNMETKKQQTPEKKKEDKDADAMGLLGGLLSANHQLVMI